MVKMPWKCRCRHRRRRFEEWGFTETLLRPTFATFVPNTRIWGLDGAPLCDFRRRKDVDENLADCWNDDRRRDLFRPKRSTGRRARWGNSASGRQLRRDAGGPSWKRMESGLESSPGSAGPGILELWLGLRGQWLGLSCFL